jgi:hypothetical protein
MHVPEVEPEAQRVLVDIGVTNVTIGGVPTVTEQGDVSAPALPAMSVPFAVTWSTPRGSVTAEKVANPFIHVVGG